MCDVTTVNHGILMYRSYHTGPMAPSCAIEAANFLKSSDVTSIVLVHVGYHPNSRVLLFPPCQTSLILHVCVPVHSQQGQAIAWSPDEQ